MKLSVIIVNYNVKYFIEQCLNSVYRALAETEAEIWVVDNNSVDGSCSMIKEKFPEVKLIENQTNPGFSIANNQAIRKASGEYILLLNPDTIVQEDTFIKCIEYMDKHQNAGGLGIKMVDGKGKFLPESKRALPTPIVSLYKITGLSSLFPKSKTFSKYHLGHLDKNQIHEIEILAGAYMFLRKKVLDEIGLLDECFFMYGEDIDLSYRILKAGYKNIYFPKTQILHYKGESTKKGSINYVLVFYKAMIIFAKKHFSKKNAKAYAFLIHIAIYVRAFLAIAYRIGKSIAIPFIDALVIYGGFYAFTLLWQKIKFDEYTYHPQILKTIIPAYIIISIVTFYFSGIYDKKKSKKKLFSGITYSILALIIFYAFLPEDLRFSRAVLAFGSLWIAGSIPLYRTFLELGKVLDFNINKRKVKNIALICKPKHNNSIEAIFQNGSEEMRIVGNINPINDGSNSSYLGNTYQLEEIVRINKIQEIIFSENDLSSGEIIGLMLKYAHLNLDFKIVQKDFQTIIGSSTIKSIDDIYQINLNSIEKEENKRLKRVTDLILCLFALTISPIWIAKFRSLNMLKACCQVLLNRKTWIGYIQTEKNTFLPHLKPSVFDLSKNNTTRSNLKENTNYARNYKPFKDFKIFFKKILKKPNL